MTLPLIIIIMMILISYKVTACRFTIDHFGIDLIDKVACAQMEVSNPFSTTTDLTPATPITAWNAGITSGQEWVWKKNELLDLDMVTSYSNICRKAA